MWDPLCPRQLMTYSGKKEPAHYHLGTLSIDEQTDSDEHEIQRWLVKVATVCKHGDTQCNWLKSRHLYRRLVAVKRRTNWREVSFPHGTITLNIKPRSHCPGLRCRFTPVWWSGMNRDEPCHNRGGTVDNLGDPGWTVLNRVKPAHVAGCFKMFKTTGTHRE